MCHLSILGSVWRHGGCCCDFSVFLVKLGSESLRIKVEYGQKVRYKALPWWVLIWKDGLMPGLVLRVWKFIFVLSCPLDLVEVCHNERGVLRKASAHEICGEMKDNN